MQYDVKTLASGALSPIEKFNDTPLRVDLAGVADVDLTIGPGQPTPADFR